ncbi:MAG: tRNA (N6-isopentenyl adenosine(37)-C2)-methylthiotransferase MiaB [Alphaproteobacteria bacterium]|nr:MAG: tRNA (N6-isopentenyl adenosine(37)-C2)-methylthiotransferase MiaB [Alphaproteobacteria bacterium]
MPKGLYIKTFGCQMNIYDSQKMADILLPLGYEIVEDVISADAILMNTCHIREKATEKVFSDLGRYRDISAHKTTKPVMIVAGCVAQAEGEAIMAREPFVDMVVGPQNYHDLPKLLAQVARNRAGSGDGPGRGILAIDFPEESKFDALPESTAAVDNPSQFLTIQEGCDKFCHFCCVPYTRGAEYSRPAEDILTEARALVDRGAREITLLGQNVNAYHGMGVKSGEWGLGDLLFALADLKGLSRIRYMTSHPRDVDDRLIEAHRDIDTLMPFLHLPVQSGSDRMLKAMNRRHTAAFYREIIAKLRDAQPNLAFSSDFIVGYPGETDEDFADTLALVKAVNFAQAFSFVYSPRPGTPAAAYEDQLPASEKHHRLEILQTVLHAQQLAFNQSFVGKEIPVLLEKTARHGGQVIGRSAYWQNVLVEANPRLIGQVIPVKIKECTLKSLLGDIVGVDGDIMRVA